MSQFKRDDTGASDLRLNSTPGSDSKLDIDGENEECSDSNTYDVPLRPERGRPRKMISEMEKGIIKELFTYGNTQDEILALLKLAGSTLRRTRLQAYLRENGMVRYKPRKSHEEVAVALEEYFHGYFHTDNLIADELLDQHGLDVTEHTVKRARLEFDMKRKTVLQEERLQKLRRATEFLLKDDEESGAVRGYGRAYLHVYLRTKAGIVIDQNALYHVYKSFPEFNEGVLARSLANRVHPRNFKVPGPNYLWAMDGYEKLKPFGFSIYACIDAYSRKIIWIWVGRANISAMCTLKQFLLTVDKLGYRPFFTRTDQGSETPLMAGGHAILAGLDQTVTDDLTGTNADIYHHQGELLKSVHIWGTSTGNQRIESWWTRLMLGCTIRWISFSRYLVHHGLFIPGDMADQIAVYAIYGPMIQAEVGWFVGVWNGHRIRPQKNRPHLVSGVPEALHARKDTRNFAVQLRDRAREGLDRMLQSLEDVDIDTLLDETTRQWCDDQLKDIGITKNLREQKDGHKYPHIQAYLALKDRIATHLSDGRWPPLAISEPSTGGTKQFLELLQKNSPHHPSAGDLDGAEIPEYIISAIQDTVEDHAYHAQRDANELLPRIPRADNSGWMSFLKTGDED